MELKYPIRTRVSVRKPSSNRTFMELKYINTLVVGQMYEF